MLIVAYCLVERPFWWRCMGVRVVGVNHSGPYIAHLQQQCHNSKLVIFQEKCLKVLKYYTFLCVQRRHNCSPAASFANCIITLYLLKEHLQTFLSIPVTQKCQILSCDTLVSNERDVIMFCCNALRLSVQQEPTWFTIYFPFTSIINLYMFRGGLLLIIRRYYSVNRDRSC